MALNEPPLPEEARGLGTGPADATQRSSDETANVPAVLPGG